jgi:SPFH domain/Band 7 family protein
MGALFRRFPFLKRWAGGIGVGLALLVVAATASGCFASGDPGKEGVVRNGGPFDNHNIRQHIAPTASTSWVGFGSTVRYYPASFVQRYYTITSQGTGDRPGVDVVTVPSQDGVQVGIEGTFYFRTVFDGSDDGTKLLDDFDTQFGNRTFPAVDERSTLLHVYDDDAGWSAFLDAIVRPVIDNDLRQEMLKYRCAELISSCAYVTNSQSGATNPTSSGNGQQTQANLQQIEQDISRELQSDLADTLGEGYLEGVRFNLSRVTLPEPVQDAINQAQSAFANVAKAQAAVQAAKQQAAANRIKQQGYHRCPGCLQLDELTALQQLTNSQVTVIMGVDGNRITVPAK